MAAVKPDATKKKGDTKAVAAEGAPAAPAKKRGKLIPAIAILALLAAGGGGAAWYFAAPSDAAPRAATARPPVFVPLEMFTVNLQPEDGQQQYLQVGLTLKVLDQATADRIKQSMPEIRNRILLLLSARKASQLLGDAGKRALAGDIMIETIAVVSPRLANAQDNRPQPVTVAQAPAASASDTPPSGDGGAAGDAPASDPPAKVPSEPQGAGPAAAAERPDLPVSSVLFTAFIIQ